ncbi:MAG: P-loop containing nucleoside triphosphate hydrolase protein [Benjaminiella poitrasii]|nr:MAG: P-loop containing nucleoside triphosphate hydrolase protein [Benjaminiella poitrasii]
MAPLEIIGAGYGRTGTDSLRRALDMLGYKTHHMKSFQEDPTIDPDDFYNAYHDRAHANWDKMYANYTAAVDWPTAAYYKDLLAYYPTAKVILTVRSAESWYASVKNTIRKYQLRSLALPEKDERRQRMIRMTVATCLDGLMADDAFEDQEAMQRLFLEHIEQVKRIVPGDQLLVMQLGEGWERLCEFLGKSVPDVPYPHVNSTVDHLKRFEQK